MAGIQGIAGLAAPASTAPAPDRGSRADGRREPEPGDSALFSSQAVEASLRGKLVAASSDDFRDKRVEEARRRLEEGAHRVQTVLLKIAARISPYLE